MKGRVVVTFALMMVMSAPFVYALLTAEILTPWLDRLIRPSAARSL